MSTSISSENILNTPPQRGLATDAALQHPGGTYAATTPATGRLISEVSSYGLRFKLFFP